MDLIHPAPASTDRDQTWDELIRSLVVERFGTGPPARHALAVVPGEVGQAGDGGLVPDGGVGPVVVVVVQPGR